MPHQHPRAAIAQAEQAVLEAADALAAARFSLDQQAALEGRGDVDQLAAHKPTAELDRQALERVVEAVKAGRLDPSDVAGAALAAGGIA